MSIIIAILFFGFMIFIHEFGHFISARIFGVTVHEFAIGMGPKLISWGKGETKYSLRLIPMGGFVRLEGEDESSEEEGSLSKKPAWQRLIILLSGAFMNILLGFLIFLFLNFSLGASTNVVQDVVPDSPAEASGILAGDEIVKLNHTKVHTFDDVRYFMYRNGGEEVTVTVERDGERKELSLTPKFAEGAYQLGVYSAYVEHPSFFQGISLGFYDTLFTVKAVYLSLWDLITGNVGMNEVSGPIGIVSTISDVSAGLPWWAGLLNILSLMAMITVNLGVFNILPFPALDGGRAVFALLEMVRRKPIKPEHEGYVHAIGFMLLIALMIFVTWSDITKLFS